MKIIKWEEGTGTKKYKITLSNGNILQFGNKAYQQYRDSSPLGLYSHLDHNDENRKRLFRKRHEKNIKKKYSPAYYANKYLWS